MENKWQAVKITLLNEVIIKDGKKQIARLMGDNEDEDYPTEEEREQNAKLIASAPDLLEALMDIVTKNGFITTTENKIKALNAIKKATE